MDIPIQGQSCDDNQDPITNGVEEISEVGCEQHLAKKLLTYATLQTC